MHAAATVIDTTRTTNDMRTATYWTAAGISIFLGSVGVTALLLMFTNRACIRWMYIILALLVLVLASVLRGAAMGALTGIADACHNVTGQALVAAGESDNGLVAYYLACNTPFPYAREFASATNASAEAVTNMEAVAAFVRNNSRDHSLANFLLANTMAINDIV